MAQDYTKEDLINNNRLFANKLRTRVLQDFYTQYLTPQAYIYVLNNGEIIHLLFDNDQFCHLLGFSYFQYNGIAGWSSLKAKNILISNLHDISNHKREEIRITNFPKILHILNNPTVYLYKNNNLRYKSDYFAVWNDGKRYYKLGIGTTSNGVNYPETFQVSLMSSPDNQEIDPNKLLTINSQFIMPKETFKNLYYPNHMIIQNQEKRIQELTTQLKEFKTLEWELIVNASTN